MNTIKPIPTTYRGCTFRSRTEARWAAFLDKLGVPYTYEPEGIDLDGDWYLPDFWLPTGGLWLEIKGVAPNPREVRVAGKLAKISRCPVAIAIGAPPTIDRGNLIVFQASREPDEAAVTCWGENVFISNDAQSLSITLRGSWDNIGGIPDTATEAARYAANLRFGVHE